MTEDQIEQPLPHSAPIMSAGASEPGAPAPDTTSTNVAPETAPDDAAPPAPDDADPAEAPTDPAPAAPDDAVPAALEVAVPADPIPDSDFPEPESARAADLEPEAATDLPPNTEAPAAPSPTSAPSPTPSPMAAPPTLPHPAGADDTTRRGSPGHPGPRPGAPGRPTGRPGAAGKPGGHSRTPGRSGGGHPGTPTAPVVAAPEPAAPPTDPHAFGRIDEDGVVYVRTAAGERTVGNWQAGDAEAGLEHFGRRFDDFATEIALLEARLGSGAGDPKATRSQAVALRESIDTLAAVGDLDGAVRRLDAVITAADGAMAAAAAARAAARARAVQAKEALCAEAEALAESTQWKVSGDRLKTIVDEWRNIHGIDRKTDDALWKRFAHARDAFTRARGSHFAELDQQRVAAKETKEKLIKRAQELSGSRDWAETAAAYRTLMAEWKAAGRAPRDVEDELWGRFRAAQEGFFARRNQTFAERDAEFEANAALKDKLLAEAEQIDVAADLEAAKEKLRSVQDRWEAAGKVPRERIRELDGRLRAVEERVRAATDAQWRRSDPEAEARVAQFRARAEQFRAQAARARAAGDERKAAEADRQAATWEQWLKTARDAVDS